MSDPASCLDGKRVIVLGLGVTGRSMATVLADRGARVLASDAGTPSDLDAGELGARGVDIELQGHDRAAEALDDADFVVPSPGISPHRGFLADVVARGAPIVSELDLGVVLTDVPVVAVTGTNGKTTVCRLAERIAREAGIRAYMCGNTEIPFVSAAAEHPDADLFVVEASSFRLHFCTTFHPRVSVITNLAPDHLDWHATLDEYREAKARIAARQTRGDLFLYPQAQPELAALAPTDGPAKVPFGARPMHNGDAAWFEGDEIVVRIADRTIRAAGVTELAVRGAHFAADAAAAATALVFFGAPSESIERALESFEVAQHRLEPVGTLNGVTVIDDSVSANAHATVAAVRHVSGNATEPRVVLIAGGRNKGIDLSPLASLAAQVKCVVAIGEAAEELANVFADSGVPVKIVGSMNEAVGVALSEARRGDVVLMSPACASFDMFRGYADRGRAFVEACRAHGVSQDGAKRLPRQDGAKRLP